jgi:hypothetical protein
VGVCNDDGPTVRLRTLGTIAIYAAIASFIGAAAMAALSLLGWRHLRRVPADQEVRVGIRQPAPALG